MLIMRIAFDAGKVTKTVEYLDDWSEARKTYEAGYGCSCHLHPPCGFCASMTEAEADAYANGGMKALTEYWKGQK